MQERNEKFLYESKKYTKEVKKVLPEMIDRERDLKEKKLEYATVLDKMVSRLGRTGNVGRTIIVQREDRRDNRTY